MKPYSDTQTHRGVTRLFEAQVDSVDLKWHRDAEDRWIKSSSQTDWRVQLDNQLPTSLTEEVFIPAGEWHRLIKGTGDLVIEIRKGAQLTESAGAKIGYRAGEFNPNQPAEMLSSKGIGLVKSRVGLLGSGYYFVGDKAVADSISSEVGHGITSMIDLSHYNLYRPSDPEAFYENLRDLTKYFNEVTVNELKTDDFKELFEDAVEIFSEYLNLGELQIRKIFVDYLRDVLENKEGTLLSNRLLEPFGFDGIDFTNTDLDHYGVGSLIFTGKLKEGTYQPLIEEKSKVNPAYLTKDAATMRSEIKKNAKKKDDDSTAYVSHPSGGWKADYSKSGKRYKTKPSKYTLAYQKKFGK
jgi:hypothetical protein